MNAMIHAMTRFQTADTSQRREPLSTADLEVVVGGYTKIEVAAPSPVVSGAAGSTEPLTLNFTKIVFA
jgi:hypothetical protein